MRWGKLRLTRRGFAQTATLGSALLAAAQAASAHGIAGNRYFDGTLCFDDPAVADEATLPLYQSLAFPAQNSNTDENRLNWAFVRLLTPALAFVADGGWLHQNWPVGHTSGLDKTDIGFKYEAYRNNQHETLISVGLMWGIAHSGARAVGADAPNTLQPGLFIGKGLGDLPDSLSWLRPLAITAAFVDELPLGRGGMALAPNPAVGRFDAVLPPTVETLHWGFSIQFSTLYLTSRFNGGPPKDEPLNQFVPLVEFKFDSPRGQYTAATMNPGLAYVAVAWQAAAEAIIPLNRAGGNSAGFRAQLLFFLDDLIPSVFGRPLLSDKPARSQIAW